jgi:DNA modification methylase
LVGIIVRFATKEGDSVLDPFAGRGTTGIVAASLGRKFVGIDLYKENVNKAGRNIAKADGSGANLIMGLAPNRQQH